MCFECGIVALLTHQIGSKVALLTLQVDSIGVCSEYGIIALLTHQIGGMLCVF